jgi:hypothetical protein
MTMDEKYLLLPCVSVVELTLLEISVAQFWW